MLLSGLPTAKEQKEVIRWLTTFRCEFRSTLCKKVLQNSKWKGYGVSKVTKNNEILYYCIWKCGFCKKISVIKSKYQYPNTIGEMILKNKATNPTDTESSLLDVQKSYNHFARRVNLLHDYSRLGVGCTCALCMKRPIWTYRLSFFRMVLSFLFWLGCVNAFRKIMGEGVLGVLFFLLLSFALSFFLYFFSLIVISKVFALVMIKIRKNESCLPLVFSDSMPEYIPEYIPAVDDRVAEYRKIQTMEEAWRIDGQKQEEEERKKREEAKQKAEREAEEAFRAFHTKNHLPLYYDKAKFVPKKSTYSFLENHVNGILTISSSERNELFCIIDCFFACSKADAVSYLHALKNESDPYLKYVTRSYSDYYAEVYLTSWAFNHHDEDWDEYEFLRAEKITEDEYNMQTKRDDLQCFTGPFDRLKQEAEKCYVYVYAYSSDGWYDCRVAYVKGLRSLSGFYRLIYARSDDRD